MLKKFEKYCNAFGVSGMEDSIRALIIEDIKDFCEYRVDRIGNLICFKKGKKAREKSLALYTGMDESGLMVDYVTDEGLFHFGTMGGVESKDLCGKYLEFTEKRLPAVIGSKAIHNQKPEERGICPPVNQLYMDIGADNKNDALKYGNVGDCACFRANFAVNGEYIKSKAIKNRITCGIFTEIIKDELEYDTYFVFTVSEEVGSRGAAAAAYGLKSDYAIVCTADSAGQEGVTPASMCSCFIGDGAVIAYKDASVIYDRAFTDSIVKAADNHKVKYQVKRGASGHTAARTIQTSVTGCKTATVALPARGLDSPAAVCKCDDVNSVLDLLKLLVNRSYE